MIKFTKMHGLGNDFVVINAIDQQVQLSREQIRYIADRHFGVGCDQILLVEKPKSDNADFTYRIFNADGSEVAQCGNGARCFAKFVRDKQLSNKNEIVVDTQTAQLRLLFTESGLITVNMGIPKHAPAEIPLIMPDEAKTYQLNLAGTTVEFVALSIGNPHAVICVADIDTAPVVTIGAELESHAIFPQRANIGFMQVLNPHNIKLRVYERGAGETMACGSGACAAVIAGIERNLLAKDVQVELLGGSLNIHWLGRGTPVWMTGSASLVYEGQIAL